MGERFLLLGVGNPDRGDDGVGPLLAEKLKDHAALKKRGVWVSPHFGEGASLMELWEGAQMAVIVDAMKSGAPPGQILRLDAVRQPLQSGVFHYSSHLFSLAEAVEMSRRLGSLPQAMVVYGIEGQTFSFGAPLSAPVAEAMESIQEQVVAEFTNAGFAS